MRRLILLLFPLLALRAETRTMTMAEAVAQALTQNPEVLMARMEEIKSKAGVVIAHDPFVPRIGLGSGLAYSSGFPLSIEGSAPAVLQARVNQYLYNQPQKFAVKQAQELAKATTFGVASKKEDIAYRVASLFLDTDRVMRLTETARKQIETLQKLLKNAQDRVEEGRSLPLEAKEANVNLLRAKVRLQNLEAESEFDSRSLAAALGYPASDVIQPSAAERHPVELPASEQAALEAALAANNDLKKLEANYAAKGYEIKGAYAQRLPRIDLIGQYALLTKYSHYDLYFNQFQRNNGQIGASIQVPFLVGPGVKAMVQQSESEQMRLRTEMTARRNQIMLDVHQSYQELQKVETNRELAQAELDLARAQLTVVLAQLSEGRAALKQVEEARFNENEKWIAFYDAQCNVERARLGILRYTGELSAALRQ